MENLTQGALNEIIKQYAPKEYNSIIIDNAVAIKRYNYCYIEAFVQRIEYKTERRSASIDDNLAENLRSALGNDNKPYVKISPELVEQFDKAPRFTTEDFFSSTKKKMAELMNGGREVDHHHLELAVERNYIANVQSPYAVKTECSIERCPNCEGKKTVESTDNQGNATIIPCPKCKGNGNIGTLAYFIPKVTDKKTSLTLCLEGEIDGFPPSAIKALIDEKPLAKRMLAHYNSIDYEAFDEALKPYLDIVRDKIGEGNAIEEYYYKIIPCHTFSYRNILTGELKKGVVVNPSDSPEIVFIGNGDTKLVNRMKDSAKLVSRFFGNIGRSSSLRNKQDLKHTVRLMIATVVADGIVSEEEKQSLTLAIRNIDELTSKEQEEMTSLLSYENTGFLTDDDYHFQDIANANETLARMQEIANSDGLVHETERELIERLKLEIDA